MKTTTGTFTQNDKDRIVKVTIVMFVDLLALDKAFDEVDRRTNVDRYLEMFPQNFFIIFFEDTAFERISFGDRDKLVQCLGAVGSEVYGDALERTGK